VAGVVERESLSFDQKRTNPVRHIRRWDTCPKTGHFAAGADRKSDWFCHDMALPGVKDISADDVR
jgi:hypothetical protein